MSEIKGSSCDALEAIFGVFVPQRMHMRLAGSVEDYVAGNATAAATATWVHEHMHFFQALFTGFGQISWSAYQQLTSHLISEWRRLDLADGKLRLPLGFAATVSDRNRAIASIAYMAAREQMKLGACRFSMDNPGATLEEADLKFLRHPWLANPTIQLRGEAHVLQGKEVLEGQAHFVERSFLTLAGIAHEAAWDRGGIPKQYVVALDWFLQECGNDRFDEFPVICDLALQTSWRPVIPHSEDEWQQTSPSWRFVRLVNALNRTGRRLGPHNRWQISYLPFANALLAECGFPLLENIFRERLEALARKPELLEIEKVMRRALLYRADHPWTGANPATDIEALEFLVHEFPAPLIEIEGQFGNTRPENNDANFQAIAELQYQAFASQIFGAVSAAAAGENALECAFSKFGIHRGCEFQLNAGCVGRYRPSDGTPHPVVRVDGSEEIRGCTFEMFVNSMGLSSSDMELDYTYPPPRF